MRLKSRVVLALASMLALAPLACAQQSNGGAAYALSTASKPWKGDFDGMLQRRMIRVDAPFSRSLYFVDKGKELGIGAELVRDIERWINQKYAKQIGKRPITVYIIASTRDKLLSDLRDGRTDISIGNLTVTDERLKLVDFVAPGCPRLFFGTPPRVQA